MNVALTDSCFWRIRLPFLKVVCPLQFDLQHDIWTSTDLVIICLLLLFLKRVSVALIGSPHEARGLGCFSCIALPASAQGPLTILKVVCPIMFCIPKSCRECFRIMLLAQCAPCSGHILPFSLRILKEVCPLCFAFQICSRIVSQ